MRNFVTSHPGYKQDSVLTEEINYDLLRRIGCLPDHPDQKLLGNLLTLGSKTKDAVPDILTK